MSVSALGFMVGSVVGSLGMLFAVRFVLLRFMRRKPASLIACLVMFAASFYAGDAAAVGAIATGITLLVWMSKEPAKESA